MSWAEVAQECPRQGQGAGVSHGAKSQWRCVLGSGCYGRKLRRNSRQPKQSCDSSASSQRPERLRPLQMAWLGRWLGRGVRPMLLVGLGLLGLLVGLGLRLVSDASGRPRQHLQQKWAHEPTNPENSSRAGQDLGLGPADMGGG